MKKYPKVKAIKIVDRFAALAENIRKILKMASGPVSALAALVSENPNVYFRL
jgi:hypothetical protein